MNKKIVLAVISVLIFSISIVVSAYLIGDAIKSNNAVENSENEYKELKVLNIAQVAEYLNMSEEDVKSIIEIEKSELENTGSFAGKMFPYFTVNNKLYFYKDEIDAWLQEAAVNHRYYDTQKGYIQ